MSGYKVSVGDVTVRVGTLREAGVVVMEAVTGMLARDFEGVREGAAAANRAWSGWGALSATFPIPALSP